MQVQLSQVYLDVHSLSQQVPVAVAEREARSTAETSQGKAQGGLAAFDSAHSVGWVQLAQGEVASTRDRVGASVDVRCRVVRHHS